MKLSSIYSREAMLQVIQVHHFTPLGKKVTVLRSVCSFNATRLCMCWVGGHGPLVSTHSQVVIDELRPAKQVSQPIESSQFTAQQLLSLLIGNGV